MSQNNDDKLCFRPICSQIFLQLHMQKHLTKIFLLCSIILIGQCAQAQSVEAAEEKKTGEVAEADLENLYATLSRPLLITPKTVFKNKRAHEYIMRIREKIEDCGTENFPSKEGKKLYGKGIFRFITDRTGALKNSIIVFSSKNAELDHQMLEILAASAPFGPVPTEIHQGIYSDLVVYSGFNFVHNDEKNNNNKQIKYHCKVEKPL